MKLVALLLFIFLSISINGQPSIKLNFLYGSKPAKGHKDAEAKYFGGLNGGHVNIEANGKVLDFLPGKCPIFSHPKKPTGGFHINSGVSWDTARTKWMTIEIPLSPEKLQDLEKVFEKLSQETPYDYAVFGMRCASASYDVLSRIGLVKKNTRLKNITRNFYPKLLRKRMLKWAKKNNYTVIFHEGRRTRRWELDKGPF